jgi:DNA-directed RNA polymerase specialized sigma24 family protein
MNPTCTSARSLVQTTAAVDAWLQWFVTERHTACRASLCTRYALNALDAEALISAACLQVFLHWAAIDNPLAYVWQTLRHAVIKQRQRDSRERRGLAAYAQQHRSPLSEHTALYVADLLEHVSPRQRCLLEWYAAGVEDVQVAAWLRTTPLAVRVARHGAYRTLRAPGRLGGGHSPQSASGKTFWGRA